MLSVASASFSFIFRKKGTQTITGTLEVTMMGGIATLPTPFHICHSTRRSLKAQALPPCKRNSKNLNRRSRRVEITNKRLTSGLKLFTHLSRRSSVNAARANCTFGVTCHQMYLFCPRTYSDRALQNGE